jgi:hypothetical protein
VRSFLVLGFLIKKGFGKRINMNLRSMEWVNKTQFGFMFQLSKLTPSGPGVGDAVTGDVVGRFVGIMVGERVVGEKLGAKVPVSLLP